jgi:hypothetical protein
MLKHDLLFRVFQSANMWLGTDIEYTSESSDFELQVNGEADLFIGVLSIESVSLKCSYD